MVGELLGGAVDDAGDFVGDKEFEILIGMGRSYIGSSLVPEEEPINNSDRTYYIHNIGA